MIRPIVANPVIIDGKHLSLADVCRIAYTNTLVTLSEKARAQVKAARATVDRLLKSPEATYGINTGFGFLSNVRIEPDKLDRLQVNLLRSHASGVGEPLSIPIVRAAMALRANVMAMGNTGVRPEIVDALLELLNEGVTPVVPSKGSVGASGDLAPLSHMALVLIGEGEAYVEGRRLPGMEALQAKGLSPVTLKPKEGLSLVNGTQIMTALGIVTLTEGRALLATADIAGATAVEVVLGTPRHFDERIIQVRPHPGAITCARNLRNLLADSEIAASHAQSDHRVQDAYSLRCTPQVHGAVRDALDHVAEILEREVNACTDNPLVFAEDDELLAGGNFHGQPVAMGLDYLASALATLGNISERRTEQMINPRNSGLPPFLAAEPGLESGFMIPQVTAAALVSENKALAHPASVDSIPTSGGQEDHVSMGVTAALKAQQIIENTARILAIELLVGARGLDLRGPTKPGVGVLAARQALAERVEPWTEDKVLGPTIEEVSKWLRDGWLEKAVQKAGIELQ